MQPVSRQSHSDARAFTVVFARAAVGTYFDIVLGVLRGNQMHKRLITDVLRNELNFSNGFVHSDGGCVISCNMGTYRLASTEGEAATLSLRAGVDMDFAGCSYSHLAEEVESGRVNVSYLDRAVSNVLRVKFATGELGPSRDALSGRP